MHLILISICTCIREPRIYRKLKKLHSLTINEPIKKWAAELNRTFSKEEVQMAKKTHEKILTIPGHKGNANQNHTKSHYS
jgi:hypothetical protein